jgi:hypothetical protein
MIPLRGNMISQNVTVERGCANSILGNQVIFIRVTWPST